MSTEIINSEISCLSGDLLPFRSPANVYYVREAAITTGVTNLQRYNVGTYFFLLSITTTLYQIERNVASNFLFIIATNNTVLRMCYRLYFYSHKYWLLVLIRQLRYYFLQLLVMIQAERILEYIVLLSMI